MPNISVVVPTLNEAANIDPLISRIEAACADAQLKCEILVVDDQSSDDTQARVRRLEGAHPVRLLARQPDQGLAGAVLYGARQAAAEVVVVMDADLSHPPEVLPLLAAPVLAGAADMAIGSRYVPGGSTPGWSPPRRLLSRFATLFSWPLTEVQDPLSGFFAVRRDHLLAIKPMVSGFKIGLELLAQGGESLKVVEVPITFHDRQRGQSKFGLTAGFAYLGQLARLLGGSASGGSALRFVLVGLLGMVVDLSLFSLLLSYGVSLGSAHVASFLLASANNYLLNARWSFRDPAGTALRTSLGQYGLFLLVAVLALCLRGGILAALTDDWGWAPRPAMLPAVAAAAAVNYFGAAWLVFPPRHRRVAPELRWNLITWAVVIYLLGLRLFFLGGPELLQEEAYYWGYAQRLDFGYLDHPPMVAWLIRLSTTLFGDTEFAVRLPAFLCWLAAARFVFKMGRDFYQGGVARRALGVFAVLPIFFAAGFFMTPDAPLIACWAAALHYLQRALLQERERAWLGAGAALGLGLLSKYSIALLGLATLVYLLVDRRSRRWLLQPAPYLGALLAVLICSPVIAWNAQHDWASFAFQSTRRLAADFHFALPELIASMLLLITPTAFLAACAALFAKVWGERRRLFESPWVAGAGVVCAAARRRFVLVYALVPLAVLVLFSLSRAIKLNWTGPVWLVLVPWLAHTLCSSAVPRRPWLLEKTHRLWPATMAAVMLVLAVALHVLTLAFPIQLYPVGSTLMGWHDLAAQIEQIEDRLEKETGQEPIVVGMDKYGITSRLTFYRLHVLKNRSLPEADEAFNGTVGRHLLGQSALMYEWWQPHPAAPGAMVILVDEEPRHLTRRSTEKHFDGLSPVEEVSAHKNGSPVGTFYYRVGRWKG